jgi:hypothetical protein
VSFAIRLAATRLLRGATWAGEDVLNSPVEPIAEVMSRAGADPRPVIGVFTSEVRSDPTGRDLASKSHTVEMAIFAYLPPKFTPAGDDEIEIDHSGSAFALDFIARQATLAIRVGTSPWNAIWNKIVLGYKDVAFKPVLVELDKGVRVACTEISLTMQVIPEPDTGRGLYGVWGDLDTLMRSDPETLPLADTLKGLIEGSAIPSWRVAQYQLAMSDVDIRAIGLAPQDTTETGEPAELEDIAFSGVNSTGVPNIPEIG